MARRKADAPIDLGQTHDLTAGLIAALRCPEGKAQAFLRDSEARGLRVRVTHAGAKSYVFESKVNGKTLRRTIGDATAWTIPAARTEANRLRVLVDNKTDPRELERQQAEEAVQRAAEAEAERLRLAAEQEDRARAEAAEQARLAVTLRELWDAYVAERRQFWGEKNLADHMSMVQEGGRPRKRMPGAVTKPGALAALMPMRLVDLTPAAIEKWAASESADRPARVRLALRLLKACLRWAADEPAFSALVNPAAATAKKAREIAGKAKPKDDLLEKGQLKAWFAEVRAIRNPAISAALQVMVLTGCRPGEALSMRWDDVNEKWGRIRIRDKVEGYRDIPLTPFVRSLLSALPRRNEWVFSSDRVVSLAMAQAKRRQRYHESKGQAAPVGAFVRNSSSGRIVEPGIAHRKACAAAGIENLSLHGLRRTYSTLTQWLEIPAGAVAQIQGHKPSATVEKHYVRRPTDMLRVHAEKIEAWFLAEAGIEFDAAAETSALRVVA
jgi:integrase